MFSWLPTLLACGRDPSPPLLPVPSVDLTGRAVRISMALRGLRPTEAELATISADPAALDALLDDWLHDPAFGLTVRDLHAERLEMRADEKIPWPSLGPLVDHPTGAISRSMNEQSLRLVERVVAEGRPYTEILTAADTDADIILAAAYGLPFDPAGPEWQVSAWTDGRPAAGILASTGVWLRHFSNASGKHRVRAEFVARSLLCDEIGSVDMPFVPAIDAPDDLSMAEVLASDPNCIGCHQKLDPLAAVFWPFTMNVPANKIVSAYEDGCVGETAANCYPVTFWRDPPLRSQDDYGLPAPGYFGEPLGDVGDLARLVAADPRFATCTARHTRAFLAQEEVAEVDPAEVARLAEILVDSGWDFRALARAVVTSPSFTAHGGLAVRPEAYARLLESWSGCPLVAEIDPEWGPTDLAREARNGWRVLLGGTDHEAIKRPDHTFDAPRVVAIDAMAEMAAGCALERWVADPSVTEPTGVRQGLADLHAGVLGVRLDPADPALDPAQALFDAGLAARDAPTAWTWVLRGLFADPAVVVY